uniref:SXP/RAL-2 family protein Ani s 5-like cation-binding domain-containing protein n=1 Tax=Panagrellus redivivus TaxID=6233 RepID=A0A7E4UY91_PANRE
MFKLLLVFCVVSAAVAAPVNNGGSCIPDDAKKVLGKLTKDQQIEVRGIYQKALAPNSRMTKVDAMEKFHEFTAKLSPEMQLKIGKLVPTEIPEVPKNLSPAATELATKIREIKGNIFNTMAEDKKQISDLMNNADPAVVAELKTVKTGKCAYLMA